MKFIQREHVIIYAWLMLQNQVHLIAQNPNMSKHIAGFKSFTGKKIIAYLEKRNAKTIVDQLKYYKISSKGSDQKMQLWQEGIHPQMITTEIMMRQKIEYIH